MNTALLWWQKNILLVTVLSHRGTDKYFLLYFPFIAAKYLIAMYSSAICMLNPLVFMW